MQISLMQISMTLNMTETKLGPVSNIPPGEGRVYSVNGEKIAVFHTRSGAVYAVQAECPHRGGPLADGLVGGTTLICPLHAWKFDLTTGHALFGDCGVKTFPVHVDDAQQIILLRGE
jgi:nitrite reductase (NADH) small subunit